MGKKSKEKKKGKGAEKTISKTEKKLANKMKKELNILGEDEIESVLAEIENEERKKQEIIEKIIDSPSRRLNFSLIPDPDKDQLIMFGGEFYDGQKTEVYNDLIFYNIAKNAWAVVKSPGAPPPRSGHQMVATLANGGQLWLFGGEFISRSQSQFHHYQDLWVFHLLTKKWEKVMSPNGPNARSGHRMVFQKRKLYVFGGFHDNTRQYKYFNDFHMFDLETFEWHKLEITGSKPSPRSGCVMLPLKDGKIFIHGGYMRENVKKDIDKGHVYSDCFLLQPDKNDATGNKWKSVQIKLSGHHFSPRCSLACTISSNFSTAYCFGGVFDVEDEKENLNGQFYNDLIVLDLEKFQCRCVNIGEKPLIQNIQSTEKQVEQRREIANDGIFTVSIGLNPSLAIVESPVKSEKNENVFQPCPRISCGLAIKRGILYLYGGMFEVGDKQITLNDFYSIDLRKMNEWKIITDDKNSEVSWVGSDSSDDETSTECGEEDSNEENN